MTTEIMSHALISMKPSCFHAVAAAMCIVLLNCTPAVVAVPIRVVYGQTQGGGTLAK